MGQASSYRIAALAIGLCLLVAAAITILGTPPTQTTETIRQIDLTGKGTPAAIVPDETGSAASQGKSNKIRILWYDSPSRTYTFRDYDRPDGTDPASWTDADLPQPENGTIQRQPAMVRFLTWDGAIEKMTGTKYIADQETITSILNSYTLIAPPSGADLGPLPSLTPAQSPAPQVTAAPGMLIPTMSNPCNQGDGTIRGAFGYTSRHNTPVSLPIGEKNRFTPGDPDRGQPETFLPGIHHDVFSVTYPESGTNIVWNLMNTVVGAGYVPRLKGAMNYEPVEGYAPLTVRFQDQSSGGTTSNPLAGMWDFGDGTTADGSGITHRYELPGKYQVRRLVSTSCGTETITGTLSVYSAEFSVHPVDSPQRTYRFVDTSGGNPHVTFWDFNDGFSSWEKEPVHTFAAPGTYAVGLTVSGKAGSGSRVHPLVVS